MSVAYAIEISGLTKAYKIFDRNIDRLKEIFNPFRKKYHTDFYALKDVDIKIKAGTCVGIIGLNGSGKSTLLQCIAGVLTPSKGTIAITGKIAALLELGAGFNPEFTGIENIKFQCAMMGLSSKDIESLIPKVIEFADIGEFVFHPVKTYSSGMYVRLAFSVAINVNPDILIVDEALAVGDIRFQSKCLNKIREFREQGKTLIFVSHDAAAIKSLCDYAYLLAKGKLVAEGNPSSVFNTYNSIIAEKDFELSNINLAESSIPNRSGSQQVQITQISLKNHLGLPTETFVSGESLTIKCQLIAKSPTSNVALGFVIRDRFGNDIFGINTAIMSQTINFTKESLTRTVEFSMPLNLGENIYNLSLAAHSGENHLSENYDWQNNVCIFRVIHDLNFKFTGCAKLNPIALIHSN